jgi:hypothetical protein
MIENISRLAEAVAIRVSRSGFMSRAARLAGGTALALAGILTPKARAAGTTMHISFIFVTETKVGASGQQLPSALVTIQDEFGNPVVGAVVTGNWSGCTNVNGASGTTQAPNGVAQIDGKKMKCPTSNCNFIFAVTSVSKAGLTYNPAANSGSTGVTSCF